MRFTIAATLAAVAAVANAHFHLEYPSPRGAFNEDNEVNFCGTRSALCIKGLVTGLHCLWSYRFVYERREPQRLPSQRWIHLY